MEVCWVQWWGVLEMATGYKLQPRNRVVHFRLYIVYTIYEVV
jgi:hypothetical protein